MGDQLRDHFYPLFGKIIRFLYFFRLGKLFTSFLIKTHQLKRSADADLDFKVRLSNWQAKAGAGTARDTSRKSPANP